MLVVHATKKLLDRTLTVPRQSGEVSTTALGSWYATALFWRPQVAMFVNERTLLPVLVPLSPAATVVGRLRPILAEVLVTLRAPPDFIQRELDEMGDWCLTKTANRSTVGVMNEFAFLAERFKEGLDGRSLVALSLHLAEVPCGPLYKSHGSPDRELAALLSELA